MIGIFSAFLLFFIYSLFNLFTIHFTIRIRDRIIPKYIFLEFLYYLILVAYVINILEKAAPFREFDIMLELVTFSVVEFFIVTLFLHAKRKELESIDNPL